VICRARTVLYVATLHRSLTMCYSCCHSSFCKPKTDDYLNLDELFAEYLISEPDEWAAIQSPGNSFCLAIGDKKGVFPSDDPQYQLLYSELAQTTNQVVTATAGIEFSQRREEAVKKRKKRGTKHNRTQYSIDAGGVAFISIVNCDICKAKHLNKTAPHRPHHPACSKKPRTRRASEMTQKLAYSHQRKMTNLPAVPAAPPFFMQLAPSTLAGFVPPIPLAQLAAGWMPQPHDFCYKYGVGECYCAAYANYLRRKNAGMQVLGKPPHDSSCPVRRNASCH
jgi:hypothetical protein